MNPKILLGGLALLASGACNRPREADGAALRFQRLGLLVEGQGLNTNTFSVADDTAIAANDSVAWMARLHPKARGQGALTRVAAFAIPSPPILQLLHVGRFLVVAHGNEVSCYDLTGALRWRRPYRDRTKAPLVAGAQRVFFQVRGAGLYAVELASGRSLWHYPSRAGTAAGLHLRGDTLFVAGLGAQVVALNSRTGHPYWTRTLPHFVLSDLIASPKGLFLTGSEGPGAAQGHVLDPRTGRVAHSFPTAAAGYYPATAMGNEVFFGAVRGGVQALDLTSGARRIYPLRPGDELGTSLLPHRGTLWFGSTARRVYGLTPPKGKAAATLAYSPLLPFGTTELFASRGRVYFGTGDGSVYQLVIADSELTAPTSKGY